MPDPPGRRSGAGALARGPRGRQNGIGTGKTLGIPGCRRIIHPFSETGQMKHNCELTFQQEQTPSASGRAKAASLQEPGKVDLGPVGSSDDAEPHHPCFRDDDDLVYGELVLSTACFQRHSDDLHHCLLIDFPLFRLT